MPTIDPQTRHEGRVSRLEQVDSRLGDYLVSLTQIAHRWNCTLLTARQRLVKAKVPLVRFNKRSAQVWFTDLLELEKKLST